MYEITNNPLFLAARKIICHPEIQSNQVLLWADEYLEEETTGGLQPFRCPAENDRFCLMPIDCSTRTLPPSSFRSGCVEARAERQCLSSSSKKTHHDIAKS